MINLTPYMLLAPLAGFALLGLFGRSLHRVAISLIGCGTVAFAFALAIADFVSMLGQPVAGRSGEVTLWTWLTSGNLTINFGLLSDPLSAIMLLIVTGVGLLIHIYSIGYMADDPGYWRFFAFLNLFVFAMTLLVAADNFLFLLVGWAGVGLASFLLIGFWYTRPTAVAAARKAFVVNVIGDFGLMLAIFLIYGAYDGSLAYASVLRSHMAVDSNILTAITLLLFVACAAKSAQLPLHVWLPDAMEGPTPVSALIHAATMVTAGVYLVARCAPLFSAVPVSLAVVGGVGGLSAIFAASIACAQTDIKRILAYSTMSQLGYMFMGEAAGGFTSGIFHLTTHAYFKALLFMCAGAVIHALGGEQDIRKMGGLRGKLRTTFYCFLASGLALAAIFPFAGFWSKDAILGAVLEQATTTGGAEWYALYGIGLVTAGLTGFYIFRLIFVVFFGGYRGGPVAAHGGHRAGGNSRDPLANVHEPGLAMLAPMVILAALSVVGGFYGTPLANWFQTFLAPATPGAKDLSPTLFWISLAAGLIFALAGIALAYLRYGRVTTVPAADESASGLITFLRRRYYVDDLYDAALVKPIVALGRGLQSGLEDETLDGGTRGVGGFFSGLSDSLRSLQTGYTRNYALLIFLGAALFLLYAVMRP